jgi:hypothetical protein
MILASPGTGASSGKGFFAPLQEKVTLESHAAGKKVTPVTTRTAGSVALNHDSPAKRFLEPFQVQKPKLRRIFRSGDIFPHPTPCELDDLRPP